MDWEIENAPNMNAIWTSPHCNIEVECLKTMAQDQ